MKIAVLSGKGGTGKTFISVNLAAIAESSVYLDCDVEEPNGRLFFKPSNIKRDIVHILIPCVDEEKCNGCRRCVEFCKFNALAYIKDKLKNFSEICHSCGGCKLICSNDAIEEKEKCIGQIEIGRHKNVKVMTGILNLGEVSGVPIIKALLKKPSNEDLTIIDCPPGSSCSVMESIETADYCILVAEPTAFGVHNFEMVYELATRLNKQVGVIINKTDGKENQMDLLCKEKQISVLCRIAYSEKLAKLNARAVIVSEEDVESEKMFKNLLKKIQSEVS